MAVDSGTPDEHATAEVQPSTGPPLLIAAVGFASLLTSATLATLPRSVAIHILGYLTGAIIPILVIGIARRFDLERRRTSAYQPVAWFRHALLGLAVLALVAALVHVWQLATELAS